MEVQVKFGMRFGPIPSWCPRTVPLELLQIVYWLARGEVDEHHNAWLFQLVWLEVSANAGSRVARLYCLLSAGAFLFRQALAQ